MTHVADISASVFDSLIKELTRKRISVNYERRQAGSGRSQAFGIIRRWSYRPHLSRNTWMRPLLWQLLKDFAEVHVPIDWDGVTVNDDYKSAEHTDKGNEGQSYTVSFGDFTGGELCVRGQGGSLARLDTRHKGFLFNGCQQSHYTGDWTGRRFCLVFYRIIWPTKFLPRYTVDCAETPEGLLIEDEYDESVVIVDKKGHIVNTLKAPQPREWIGRLTKIGQPSRILPL
jgi:hypothetical protein